MIKLALAAGLTVTLLCGFMTFQSNLTSLFGGNQGTTTKGTLGLSGSNSLNTNSDFGGNSGGRGYLPPEKSSGVTNEEVDLTTPIFRIFLLSTTPTTPSTNTKSQTSEVGTEKSIIDISSSSTRMPTSDTPSTSSAKIETTKPTDDVISITPLSIPATPMVPPVIMLSLSGQGDRNNNPKVPVTTLQPPSSESSTSDADAENKLSEDSLDTNIYRPGSILQPPNGLYLPPVH